MKRFVLVLGALLVLGLVVSGCTGKDTTPQPSSTSTTSTIGSLDLSADLDDLESDENLSIDLSELDW